LYTQLARLTLPRFGRAFSCRPAPAWAGSLPGDQFHCSMIAAQRSRSAALVLAVACSQAKCPRRQCGVPPMASSPAKRTCASPSNFRVVARLLVELLAQTVRAGLSRGSGHPRSVPADSPARAIVVRLLATLSLPLRLLLALRGLRSILPSANTLVLSKSRRPPTHHLNVEYNAGSVIDFRRGPSFRASADK
jgi:hypothetical protein